MDEQALQPTPHPLTIYQQAVQQGVPPETLREIFELTKDYEQHEASKKYADAIAGFQSECPTVFKCRTVPTKNGGVKFAFAGYDDIKRVTRPLERKYGIVTGFDFKFAEGILHGSIRVRVGGYFEDKNSSIAVPKGYDTNAAQDYGQAMTYLKRYLYCAALDIVITDEDRDGTMGPDSITEEQILKFNTLFDEIAGGMDAAERAKFESALAAWLSEASGRKMQPTDGLLGLPRNVATQAIGFLEKKLAKR